MVTATEAKHLQLQALRPARIQTVSPEDIQQANRPSTQMLLAISATGKGLYQGTVDPVTKSRRRAKNKAARAARRASR